MNRISLTWKRMPNKNLQQNLICWSNLRSIALKITNKIGCLLLPLLLKMALVRTWNKRKRIQKEEKVCHYHRWNNYQQKNQNDIPTINNNEFIRVRNIRSVWINHLYLYITSKWWTKSGFFFSWNGIYRAAEKIWSRLSYINIAKSQ